MLDVEALVVTAAGLVRGLHACVHALDGVASIGVYDGLFFFQAEDGIRDATVTGVQTCALPIWPNSRRRSRRARAVAGSTPSISKKRARSGSPRSEERRVGKECRSRRSPYH